MVFDHIFIVQPWLNLTLPRLKISLNMCSLWKCLSNKFRNTRHTLEDAPLSYGGLYQMLLRLRFLDDLYSLIMLSYLTLSA